GGRVQVLIVRRPAPLARDGRAIIGRAAESSGWSPEDVPHIGVGLFGLVFAYFVNAVGTWRVAAGGSDPLGPSALAVQRRFLEEAILRLLGPRTAARG